MLSSLLNCRRRGGRRGLAARFDELLHRGEDALLHRVAAVLVAMHGLAKVQCRCQHAGVLAGTVVVAAHRFRARPHQVVLVTDASRPLRPAGQCILRQAQPAQPGQDRVGVERLSLVR